MHKSESVLSNETHKIIWDFEIKTDHPIPARRPDLVLINKKKKKEKRTCQLVDFPANHRVKMKENEKMDKYLDLARELKKLWNMKVNVIPIVVGALEIVPNSLEKRLENLEIRGRIETIQTTALLQSTRILRRVLETRGDLLPLKLQ